MNNRQNQVRSKGIDSDFLFQKRI